MKLELDTALGFVEPRLSGARLVTSHNLLLSLNSKHDQFVRGASAKGQFEQSVLIRRILKAGQTLSDNLNFENTAFWNTFHNRL